MLGEGEWRNRGRRGSGSGTASGWTGVYSAANPMLMGPVGDPNDQCLHAGAEIPEPAAQLRPVTVDLGR